MGTRRAKKKAKAKSPGKTPGALVVPSHGGGLIRNGSLPGNTPGTGRPPSVLREKLRGSFEDRMNVAEDIADGRFVPNMPPAAAAAALALGGGDAGTNAIMAEYAASDRLKALDLLGKYGLGTTQGVSVDYVTDRLEHTYRVLVEELDAALFDRVSTRLASVWK